MLDTLPARLATAAAEARSALEEDAQKHFVWLDEIVPVVCNKFAVRSAAASPNRYGGKCEATCFIKRNCRGPCHVFP